MPEPYTYRLTDICFANGTVLRLGNLTVVVGANNSGKSRMLKDIVAKASQNSRIQGVVADDIFWTLPSTIDELRQAYPDIERTQGERGQWLLSTLAPDLCSAHTLSEMDDWPQGHETIITNASRDSRQQFVDRYGKSLIAYLSTEHRLQLVKEADSPTKRTDAANLLQKLYNAGRDAERRVRELVRTAFGQDIALDFTTLRRMLLRIGDSFADLPDDPRDARATLTRSLSLDDQGDGFRSFVGIVIAMAAVNRSLFLIDEPETFLHPPQAFRIGEFIAQQATSHRQVIVATHSADTLRGILSKTRDVAIVRLDRNDGTTAVQVLDATVVDTIASDPLLASARVLDGVFYAGAVVVEGDRDARIYQFVSRMLRDDLDLHFVNTDGKQLVPRVIEIYRGFGVRSVGIVDFDVLNNADEFGAYLVAFGVDEQSRQSAMSLRAAVAGAVTKVAPDRRLAELREELATIQREIDHVSTAKFESEEAADAEKNRALERFSKSVNCFNDRSKAWRSVKERGRANLDDAGQKAFDSLFAICARQGLFINPCGELESLMETHGLDHSSDKPLWYERAMKMLPGMKADRSVYPWKLLEQVHSYLAQPAPSQTTSHAE